MDTVWSFTKQKLKQRYPIPNIFNLLAGKVAKDLPTPIELIAQFLITEYSIASVTNLHSDALPFNTIARVSLLADCIF
ncbi:MAG: hypothetical protein ABJA90_04615 [Ginsengibacter sp.]